jgi:hypothetical protein
MGKEVLLSTQGNAWQLLEKLLSKTKNAPLLLLLGAAARFW